MPWHTHCALGRASQDNWDAHPSHFCWMDVLQLHEYLWTCLAIYLARPCTGHNVRAGAFMCTPYFSLDWNSQPDGLDCQQDSQDIHHDGPDSHHDGQDSHHDGQDSRKDGHDS